jgi:hypothetical protein
MSPRKSELTPERRATLALKGEVLYGKSCGARGRAGCVESFARHQLRLGNVDVVRDLSRFVDGQIDLLRGYDPDGLLPMTEALAARLRQLLRSEAENAR